MTERQMLLVFALKFAEMNFWSMHTTNEPDPRVDTIFYTYERKDVEAMIAILKQEGLIEMATDIKLEWCNKHKLGLPFRFTQKGRDLLAKFTLEFES